MGRREQLVGLVVAAAVAAGAYYAAARRDPVPTVCTLGSAPGMGPGVPSELPDLGLADARLGAGGVVVHIQAPSRPIVAFQENLLLFRFEAEGESPGAALPVTDATVSFTMQMEMGANRYALVAAARPGWLQARVVLPACPSGGRRWYGTLTFTSGGWPQERRFQFDLEPGTGAATGGT